MDPRLATSLEGRYTIDREIGRGGMATVYLARDVRHNRNVALKVLNAELGAILGVERFLAEIQVTANLQHPNLLPLFDSGEASGLLFYVMPYVEGESLRARLDREKQLPVDEAVRIASAIAGALDHAHRHKVIHRDLKPENILMHEGQPLIADFGIALAVSNAGGARITQTGLSLGTPQYMSPEQATGDRVVDGRTDIYSLGAMTYEMLVGDPPHSASTAQAIIAKVLTEKPARVRTSRPNVSPAVDYAIARALEKLAADRFATAKEFAEALEGKGGGATSAAYQQSGAALREGRLSRARELTAWGLVAVFAAWFGWQHLRPHTDAEAPVVRVTFDLPAGTRVNDASVGQTIAVSPQGDLIAFTAVRQASFRMFIRHTNELTARELGADLVAGRSFAFSPNGRWVAYAEGNALRKISVDGGAAVSLGSGPTIVYGLSWSVSDTIYVGSNNGLTSIPAGGGEVRAVTRAEPGGPVIPQRWPLVLPNGRNVVVAQGRAGTGNVRLAAVSTTTGLTTVFDIPATAPMGFQHGQLVYVTDAGTIMAVTFDAEAARPSGEPIIIEDGVVVDLASGPKASLSASGTLAYQRGRGERQLLLARDGAASEAQLMPEARQYIGPRYSPDGRRIAVGVIGAGTIDVWVRDLVNNTFEKFTTAGSDMRPEWSHDGKRIVFLSGRGGKIGIWWQPVDGSGPAELLYQPDVEPYEAIISPDGKWLIYRTGPGSTNSRDILAVSLDGDRKPVPIVTGPNAEAMPRLSPDGKWLAYQSNESGPYEVYVRPFPGTGGRVQISNDNGTEPLWAKSGRTLYYRRGKGGLAAVAVTTGAAFSIGERRVALESDYVQDASHPNYDVAPDGRFLVLKRAGADAQTVIVHNWGRELREKTAVKK